MEFSFGTGSTTFIHCLLMFSFVRNLLNVRKFSTSKQFSPALKSSVRIHSFFFFFFFFGAEESKLNVLIFFGNLSLKRFFLEDHVL